MLAANEDPLKSTLQKLFQRPHIPNMRYLINRLSLGELESNTVRSPEYTFRVSAESLTPTAIDTRPVSDTAPQQLSAPNISLNFHGSSKPRERYCIAICGILLQFRILVFAGFSVYHPRYRTRFPKNGTSVRPHAFPIVATGTILLMAGMIICSMNVEQSTAEKEWGPGKRLRGGKELNAHIL
jgi:hypothetical protein